MNYTKQILAQLLNVIDIYNLNLTHVEVHYIHSIDDDPIEYAIYVALDPYCTQALYCTLPHNDIAQHTYPVPYIHHTLYKLLGTLACPQSANTTGFPSGF